MTLGVLRRRYALLCAMTTLVARSAVASPCCGPISAEGQALSAFLDATRVDQRWENHWHVNWESGERDRPFPGGREAATHCSAFVAAIAKRLGIYVLRPPEHAQELLANAQLAWLQSEGLTRGWRSLTDMRAAQAEANCGALVLAAFQNLDLHRPGHIAALRPSLKDEAAMETEGPQITQAGATNYISVTLAEGFRHHPGAWTPGGTSRVRFYAHRVEPGMLSDCVA